MPSSEFSSLRNWLATQPTVALEVLDVLPSPVCVLDILGRFLGANLVAEEIFRAPGKRLEGVSFADEFLVSKFQATFKSYLNEIRDNPTEQAEPRQSQAICVMKDGRTIHVDLQLQHLQLEQMDVIIACLKEIDSYVRMEQRLARLTVQNQLQHEATLAAVESETFEDALRKCLEIVCQVANWEFGQAWILNDKENRLIQSNIVACRCEEEDMGWKLQQGISYARGEGLAGKIWASGDPQWVSNVRSSPDFKNWDFNGLSVTGAFGFPVKLGETIVAVLEFFTPTKISPDPQFLLMVSSVGKQLGQLLQQKRFEEERNHLAAIVESSNDAIIGKSLDGTITSWNQAASRLYGYTAEEIVGKSVSLLVPEDVVGDETQIAAALLAGVPVEPFETVRRRKDGSLVHVSLTVSPILKPSGKVIGYSTIGRDISDQIRTEQELRNAKEAAEAANQAKSDFLANISHELRTPMSAILGMTELALGESLSDVVADYLDTVRDSAQTLLYLLNDLLDFSRMEAGRFELEEEPFHLRDLVDETLKLLSIRASEKGVELAGHVQRDVPDWLIGDAIRVRQILTNLLGNGIKFTDVGEVAIRVGLVKTKGKTAVIEFRISDTGIGISKKDLKKIFQPFTQVDSSTTRNYAGTGLGLAICRELLARMNGEIQVESELGRGTAFTCRIPFPITSAPSGLDFTPVEELKDLKVLVVDDNETNRRIVYEALQNWAMSPVTVESAQSALKLLKDATRRNEQFPLILVDALMPEMDGFMLVEELQKDPKLSQTTIMMLSSVERQMFADRCRNLNIAAFLEKPVSQSDLLDSIMTALKGPQLQQKPIQEIRQQTFVLKILVAEDTPANQKVVKAILTKRGHIVDIARNGREAIQMHQRNQYDVILMDVQMPNVDGFKATRAIREMDEERKAKIPILAMTAHAMRGDRERCLQAGMDDYISKPIDAKRLIRQTEKLARGQNPTLPESISDHSLDIIPALETFPEGSITLDMNQALQLMGNDKQILQEMVGFVLKDGPTLLENIRSGLEFQDPYKVERAAHSLKSLVATFGAEEVSRLALEIEDAGREEDLNTAAAKLPELESLLLLLLQMLNEYPFES